MSEGCFAYLQPDGSWGWSNAGLITDGGKSLLVDTLFDERLTADMLKIMHDAVGVRPNDIQTLVNTHANGDHTFGNHLVRHADIIASRASAEEMSEFTSDDFARLMAAAPGMGDAGAYLIEAFAKFDIAGVTHVGPTRTFSGRLDLKVGDKLVHLIEVGPAHTAGDVLVHSPQDRAVFTGDILFIEGTPIMWAGPTSNWVRACNYITELDVDTIVPGHGPLTTKAGVGRVRDYLQFVEREANLRLDEGMSFEHAAYDIALGDFGDWLDPERILINVYAIHRERLGHAGDGMPREDIVMLMGLMHRYKQGKGPQSNA